MYKQQYEVIKVLERYKLSKLTEEEIKNLNRPITNKDIELRILKLSSEKSETDGFTGQFYQIFKED